MGREIIPLTNTYSPSCEVEAELIAAASVDELCGLDLKGKILMIHGELSQAAYFPKNFDFYRDETQDKVISLMEEKEPGALIAISHQDKYLTPVLEDSDFLIPSVTVVKDIGRLLMENTGRTAKLSIDSVTKKSWGSNVIGRLKGTTAKRIIVCTHYDTKHGTQGAVDNASGVAAVLLLAKMLKNDIIGIGIEFVAFGGEDTWYPGDALYMEHYVKDPENIIAAINIDGIGMKGSDNGVAFMACSDGLLLEASSLMENYLHIKQIEPFYEGDHSFFWNGYIPTMALCNTGLFSSYSRLCHTKYDRPELLSFESIDNTAQFLYSFIHRLYKIQG